MKFLQNFISFFLVAKTGFKIEIFPLIKPHKIYPLALNFEQITVESRKKNRLFDVESMKDILGILNKSCREKLKMLTANFSFNFKQIQSKASQFCNITCFLLKSIGILILNGFLYTLDKLYKILKRITYYYISLELVYLLNSPDILIEFVDELSCFLTFKTPVLLLKIFNIRSLLFLLIEWIEEIEKIFDLCGYLMVSLLLIITFLDFNQ